MEFDQLEYGIFLVVTFLGYWALARMGAFRVVFLLVLSWVFYMAGTPVYILLILGSTLTDYVAGLMMARHDDKAKRKLWLVLSLIVNIGLLGAFKYANFFYEAGVGLGNLFGADLVFTRLDIALPAGISFYTFQTMSYSIDVYRGRLEPERDLVRFAFFVGYFPQLVAGPIVRAVDFLPQIGRRPFFSRQQASRAFWLFGIGLVKKLVIVDLLYWNLVQRTLETPELLSSADVMLGLYGYTMKSYMDFSAYTDMAIASALIFGFYLPDNFDRPYLATSVQDFWRRWHKTLGSWLRDYLYYPLGGGRGSDLKVYRNLFITFLLIGFWHGAHWVFLVYGALHATAMCINRYLRKRREEKGIELRLSAWGYAWRIFLTLNFVTLARILFASGEMYIDNGTDAWGKTTDIVGALANGSWTEVTVMTPWLWVLLLGLFAWHWTPRRWTEATFTAYRSLPLLAQGVIFGLVVLLAGLLTSGRPLPFQYYKF